MDLLRADPDLTIEMLNDTLCDGKPEEVAMAVRRGPTHVAGSRRVIAEARCCRYLKCCCTVRVQ